jgi:hypothetical protein
MNTALETLLIWATAVVLCLVLGTNLVDVAVAAALGAN